MIFATRSSAIAQAKSIAHDRRTTVHVIDRAPHTGFLVITDTALQISMDVGFVTPDEFAAGHVISVLGMAAGQ